MIDFNSFILYNTNMKNTDKISVRVVKKTEAVKNSGKIFRLKIANIDNSEKKAWKIVTSKLKAKINNK